MVLGEVNLVSVKIQPIVLGIDHCYLLRGEKTIMIDGGMPNRERDFRKRLERLSVRPEDIELLLLTHGHWDHVGSAAAIKELTGAKIALHSAEKTWLEQGLTPLPPGSTRWGRIFFKLMEFFMFRVHVPPTEVDIVLEDAELRLDDYGIPASVIPTPGHSAGSVSVLLDSGEAFVGDLAMNGFPLRFRPGLPILAEDPQMVRDSWKVLLDRGATRVFPAHGAPFPAGVIPAALSRSSGWPS